MVYLPLSAALQEQQSYGPEPMSLMTDKTVLSEIAPIAGVDGALLPAVLILVVVLLISPFRGAAVEPAR